MAIASGQTLPRSFFDAGLTGYWSRLSKHSSVEMSADSDDEYDYVASLAEQIAHAMLDDDDCHEDTEHNFFASCSLSNLDTQATTYDPRFCNSKARICGNTLSGAMLLPLYSRDSDHSSPDQFERGPGCEYARNDTMTRVSLLAEPGLLAHGSGARSRLLRWENLPHCKQQFQLAVMPLSQPKTSVPEKLLSLAIVSPAMDNAGTPSHARNASSPTILRESLLQMRHYQDWQHGGREFSNSRSRHGSRRKHQVSKGVRPGVYHSQASQTNAPRWQSPPLELAASAGVHATSLAHFPARAETTGTGVFLPRISGSGSSHRRKSESATVVSKAFQSANESHFRGGRRRDVLFHRIPTAP